MGWQFITDFTRERRSAGRIVQARKLFPPCGAKRHAENKLLVRGSVVVEFDMSTAGQVPARLIHFENTEGWARRFTIYLNADLSISVESEQGAGRSYVRLTGWAKAPSGPVRLTYSWDAPTRSGSLTAETLSSGESHRVTFDAPLPLPYDDLRRIANGGSRRADARLTYVAISDTIQPVGPCPSIGAGTLVETSNGQRPIDRLQLGDQVLTAQHGYQPIRWIIRQNLPAVGAFRPIQLRAPYLGLTQDITVSRQHRVLIRGSDAEYLFGAESVLVESDQLTTHPAASFATQGPIQSYYQIVLDDHDCINLGGAWGESLYVGNLARSPALLAASLLSDISQSSVPRHQRMSAPVLQPFESSALLDAISA